MFSPDFQHIFFPDLGADKIHAFRFDVQEKKPLTPIEGYTAIPGSGPRHFTFHPSSRFAYCIEELSGTVSVFKYEAGKLENIQRVFSYSKLQEDYGSADIHLSPDGMFLYASNRWENENTLSIFSVDQPTGKLTFVGHQFTYGDHPRNFTIDPTGRFLILANQYCCVQTEYQNGAADQNRKRNKSAGTVLLKNEKIR